MYKNIVFVMLIFMSGSYAFGQSLNLITNGSFEDTLYIPADASGYLNDEVSRCLGDYSTTIYIYPNTPGPSLRPLPKSQEGCNGWYNPGGWTTPDYFNRLIKLFPQRPSSTIVGVPGSRANNYYNGFDLQQPFDDNKNGIIDSTGVSPNDYGTENAYVGIYNKRGKDGDSNDDYAEYIQQRFENTIEAGQGKQYLVSFRVGLALGNYGLSLSDAQTGEYLKNICAYFTSAPFLQDDKVPKVLPCNECEGNDDNKFYADLVCNFALYSSSNTVYLDGTGGSSGTFWNLVTGKYKPSEDMNYITIGNFEDDWESSDCNGKPKMLAPNSNPYEHNMYYGIYYFIDSVSVIASESSTCYCEDEYTGESFYHIDIEEIQSPDDPDKCCVDVYVTMDNNPDACLFNKIKVFDGDNTTPIISFDNTRYVKQGVKTFLSTYCYDPEETGSKTWTFEFYDGEELKCWKEHLFDMECACDCDEINTESLFDITVIPHEVEFDKCCYDILVENNSSCTFFDNYPVSFWSSNYNDFSSLTFTNINWTGEYSTLNYTYTWGDGTIAPNSSQVIGSICIPKSSNTISYELYVGGYFSDIERFERCSREWTGELTCNCEDNCCDYLEPVWDICYPCMSFSFSVSHTCCEIYGWELYEWNCDVYELHSSEPVGSQPKDISSYSYILCGSYCYGAVNIQGIKIKIVLFDEDGNVKCEKEFENPYPCSDVSIERKSFNENISKTLEEKDIYNIYCKPNPAKNKLILQFKSNISNRLTIKVFDILVNEILSLENINCSKGYNEVPINTDNMVNGKYIIKMKSGASVYTIPFIVIK